MGFAHGGAGRGSKPRKRVSKAGHLRSIVIGEAGREYAMRHPRQHAIVGQPGDDGRFDRGSRQYRLERQTPPLRAAAKA
jgi:hypothetical protein